MTKLRIDQGIVRAFPDVLIGVLRFERIDNNGENPDVMTALADEQARTKERLTGIVVTEHPNIAPWREAYRKFGAKPKDYPSSIENLLRRVVKGYGLPHINLLVDIYNTISLRYLIPVGGEDLDKIRGDVYLTFASENEAPVRLLGEPEKRIPKVGEVIYKDDLSAICRRWNWKEADRTKFSEDTTNGFLVIEALPPVGKQVIEAAIDDLANAVLKSCGGRVSTEIAHSGNLEISLNC